MHPRPRVRTALIGLAAVALLSTGCGGGADTVSTEDFATPAGLRSIAERSSDASYGFEAFIEVSGMPIRVDPDAPVVTGVYDGERTSARVDMSWLFGSVSDQLPPGLSAESLTLDIVTDGGAQYVRAPFLATFASLLGNGALDAFAELGDGWGRVDTSRLTNPDIAASFGGGSGADPEKLFAMLLDVTGAEEIGTETIRGVEATGVAADVSLDDLLAAQGTGDGSVPDELADLSDVALPIEVWIDDDGLIRRIVMTFDEATLATAAEAAGEELPADALGGFHLSTRLELFDYGDVDDVEVPDDAIDVTDAVEALLSITGR